MAWLLLVAAFLLIAPWWGRGALAFARELDEFRVTRNLRGRRSAREHVIRNHGRFFSMRDGPQTSADREYEDRVIRLTSLAIQAAGLAVALAAVIVAAL